MTVEEAREKWCCTHEIEKCNANNCMAWRWKYEAIGETVGGGKYLQTAKGLCLKLKAIAVWRVRRVRSDLSCCFSWRNYWCFSRNSSMVALVF